MSSSSTTHIRRTVPALLAVLLLGTVLGVSSSGVAPLPASAEDPIITLDVEPATNVTDGQLIDVTVLAAPGYTLQNGSVHICRDGPTYAVANDLISRNGNCPTDPVSSSGSNMPRAVSLYPGLTRAGGTLRAGIGNITWGPPDDPAKFALTCGPANPCRLVVQIRVNRPGFSANVINSSTLLTFQGDDPFAGCGGSDPDALNTGGPDRLTGTWVAWTRAKSAAEGSKASTQAVFGGEGEGHRSFAEGNSDLVYSAVGPTFPGTTPAKTRPSVSVPLSLNAAVIGVLGGYATTSADWPSGVPRPFSQVGVTQAEMATLFSQGPFRFQSAYGATLPQREPELAASGLLGQNVNTVRPLMNAGSDGVTWYTTRLFDEREGGRWQTSPDSLEGNPPNVSRGVHDSFALAQPTFTITFFDLYSSQAGLKRTAASPDVANTFGPVWVLTDLATAQQLDIPTVALQNSRGEFVQPTEQSLLAATSTLERQADGTLLPPVGDAPGAYPLTFVEHAVVPTEALRDAECAVRPGAQSVLTNWLTYVTGPGQAALPDGMVALPADLAAQATESIAAVGTAPPSGECAPAAEPPPGAPGGPDAPAPVGAPGAPSFPSSDIPSGSPTGPGGTGGFGSSPSGGTFADLIAGDDGPGDTGDGADDPTDEVAISEIAYPGLGDGGSGNGASTAIALLALAALAGVGGWLSSRRPGRVDEEVSS